MLDRDQRQAIFTLKARGLSNRNIAKAMGIARNTVSTVLLSGTTEPSPREPLPLELLEENPDLEIVIRTLHRECEGYVTRVGERLAAEHHIAIPYSTLARYVNRLGLRPEQQAKARSVEIVTGPGVEMQHDTSPITVKLGNKPTDLELAELVYCYSRHRYLEFFERWQRFHLKVFFVRGITFLNGACATSVVDNARQIVILGAGPNGVIAQEMERFAVPFQFSWLPIFPGQSNRNGKVEKAHQFVQTNFLPGRSFRNLADLNEQLFEWREKIFRRPVSGQGFAPIDRWEEEKAHLKPLPAYITPVSRTWSGRLVDDYGWAYLHKSRYSVPDRFIRRHVTLRETGDEVIVLDGATEVCRHKRLPETEREQSRLPGHHASHARRAPARGMSPEERHLRSLGPDVCGYLDDLAARPIRYSYARLRRLYRFSCDYPPEVFRATLRDAGQRRAFDLSQMERVLEERMGARILEGRLFSETAFENRPAYRKGQVTPFRLQDWPSDGARPAEPCPESRETNPRRRPSDDARRIHNDAAGTPRRDSDAPQARDEPGGASGDHEGSAGEAEVLHRARDGAAGAGSEEP
jgi:transposase